MTDRRNGGEARDHGTGEPVRVLVAGGTDVIGRLVREMLGVVDGIELAYTSRKKLDDDPGRHFPLRIAAGCNGICRVFRKRDWVVNCTGPFEVYTNSLARACADSGTGYIDVNGLIDARRAIMALDKDARWEGAPILAGFSLCPGLSMALLILGARAAGVEEVRDVRVDLRIDADQESGAASIESMFRTIHGGHRAMLGGAIVEIRHNPVSSQNEVGYECPDVDIVREACPSIRGYSYHVALNTLPGESVEKICTSRLYAMPIIFGLLARPGAAVTSRKARVKDTPQPAELAVALSSAGTDDAGPSAEATVVRVTGPSSYKTTTTIAATVVVAVAGKPATPGCRGLIGHPRLLEPVLAFARDAGIHIEVSHNNPTTGPLPTAAHCDTKEGEKR